MSLSPPGYWRNEVSGALEQPIADYLNGRPLDEPAIALIRAYLCQWVDSPIWDANPHTDAAERHALEGLRGDGRRIKTRADISAWIESAIDMGIDPL